MTFVKFIFTLLVATTFLNANEILLLHSYNKGLKWSDGISKGVEDVMLKHPDYELTTEYLDSKKIEFESFSEDILELYKKKFYHRKYKAVIVADNYAFEFVSKHHVELFANTPVVFCGIENFDPSSLSEELKPYVTGAVEYKNYVKNFELIEKLLPETKTVYIMSDNTYASTMVKDQIITESSHFKDRFNIIFDNQIDFKSIDEKIDALPEKSVILLTTFYRDMNEDYVPYYKLKAFFNRTNIPIFVATAFHVGEGVLGGYTLSGYDQGYEAATKAIELINEKDMPEVPITTTASRYKFDYNILEKYNIPHNILPPSSIIVNKPLSFFEKNRKFVENAFILLPLLLLLTIFLIVNILKQMALKKELLRQKRHEQFVIQRSKQSEVGEMLTSIAHQWKNPLVEISTIAQELTYKERKKVIDKNDIRQCVDDIMTQVQYMSKTIDDFREFIKPSTTQLIFDVKVAFGKLLNVVDHNLKHNYITISVTNKSKGKLLAFGYPNEFQQTILNIINNAKDSIIKARKEDPSRGFINVHMSNDDKYIYLEISDDGVGISGDQIEEIFEPFFSTKSGGDGFGLYMARLIIEDKMGGKIVAKSKDVGICLCITIKRINEDS